VFSFDGGRARIVSVVSAMAEVEGRKVSLGTQLLAPLDTLRAATLWNVDPDGRYSVYHGDSFIQAVEWTRDGSVRSRSIQPFGSASTRPDSPYYTDQAQLFVDHRTKPVYFDPARLEGHVTRDRRVTNAAK